MKITLDPKVHRFILAAAFSAGLGFGTSAFAVQHAYLIDLNSKTATDIGALGGSVTEPTGINDAGQVVGSTGNSFDDTRAFITSADGVGIRDLGTVGGKINGAFDINVFPRISISSIPKLSSPALMGWGLSPSTPTSSVAVNA